MASPAHPDEGSGPSRDVPFYEAATSEVPEASQSSSTSKDLHDDVDLEKVDEENFGKYEELKPAPTNDSQRRPLSRTGTNKSMNELDLIRTLSRRRSNLTSLTGEEQQEEQQEIERLMSRMFGRGRQEQSEEEQTRHIGVIWKNLTVKGVGLGAALQPTNGDFFLGLPRFVGRLFTHGAKAAAGKPPVRDLLHDFTGCIRPGEMTLVLGRPGSGCSTFLKVLGNQRFGFEDIQGQVTYGGTDWKTMARDFRGEIIYNPEVRTSNTSRKFLLTAFEG